MTRRRLNGPLPETYVQEPRRLAECVAHLAECDRLGFDTEFVGEDSFRPELCLLQVAVSDHLYVIDPFAVGSLDAFWQLFTDPKRTIVVHAGREEVRMCRFHAGHPPACLFDVQIAAALVGLTYPIGYSGLVHEMLNARAGKAETLTDWRRRPLSQAQIRYAYDDVRYLLPMHDRFLARLGELRRLEWANEEFQQFITWATGDDPTVERWRKLKGIGGLSRKELATVRVLFAWREEFAARVNRPARVLLRDDLIVEMARRPPGSLDQVQGLRGIPRGESEAILAALEVAASLSPGEWPSASERENDAANVNNIAALLAVVLADFAGRHFLAPNFVATTSDLRGLVRARQPGGKLPADSPFRQGWRSHFVRPHLEAVLDGSLAIQVQNPAAASPFAVKPLRP